MKSKTIAAACAIIASAIAFVTPTAAFAAGSYPSPEYSSPEYDWDGKFGSASAEDVQQTGVSFNAACSYEDHATSEGGNEYTYWREVPVVVSKATRDAENTSLKAGEKVIVSYEVKVSEDYTGPQPTQCYLTWVAKDVSLGGQTARVFVEHSNGTTEVVDSKFEVRDAYDPKFDEPNGKKALVGVKVNGLSIFTLTAQGTEDTGKTDGGVVDSGYTAPGSSNTGKKSPVTGLTLAPVAVIATLATAGAAATLRRELHK